MSLFVIIRRAAMYIDDHKQSKLAKMVDSFKDIVTKVHSNEWRLIGIIVFVVMIGISYLIITKQDVKGI